MEKNGLAIFGFFISIAMIVCSFLFTQTLRQTIPTNQIVKVRGVAERVINSDRVDWSIKIACENIKLDTAYEEVDRTSKHLLSYFIKNGVSKKLITFSNYEQERVTEHITLDKLGNSETKFIGYKVVQVVSIIGFKDLDLIETLEQKIGPDIQRKGWSVISKAPYFYYSKKISDIKPELLKESAQNAFKRATIIAESSGSKLGGLKAARQGAFSGFGSDGFVGGYSRSHLISSVVTVDFSISR